MTPTQQETIDEVIRRLHEIQQQLANRAAVFEVTGFGYLAEEFRRLSRAEVCPILELLQEIKKASSS